MANLNALRHIVVRDHGVLGTPSDVRIKSINDDQAAIAAFPVHSEVRHIDDEAGEFIDGQFVHLSDKQTISDYLCLQVGMDTLVQFPLEYRESWIAVAVTNPEFTRWVTREVLNETGSFSQPSMERMFSEAAGYFDRHECESNWDAATRFGFIADVIDVGIRRLRSMRLMGRTHAVLVNVFTHGPAHIMAEFAHERISSNNYPENDDGYIWFPSDDQLSEINQAEPQHRRRKAMSLCKEEWDVFCAFLKGTVYTIRYVMYERVNTMAGKKWVEIESNDDNQRLFDLDATVESLTPALMQYTGQHVA